MVANAGRWEAAASFRFIFCRLATGGRKLHAEVSNSSVCKSEKKARKLAKIWTFWVLARFLDDVSMTSSGGVRVG